MKQVILKPLHHRGQECIGVYFENYPSINGTIRKNEGAKWSQTNKCWYIPLSKENYNKLFVALKGKAEIEQTALYKFAIKNSHDLVGAGTPAQYNHCND